DVLAEAAPLAGQARPLRQVAQVVDRFDVGVRAGQRVGRGEADAAAVLPAELDRPAVVVRGADVVGDVEGAELGELAAGGDRLGGGQAARLEPDSGPRTAGA